MKNFDFFRITTRIGPKGVIEVYPKFFRVKSTDLMIRGGDFYAIWLEDRGLWSTNEDDLINLIDTEIDAYIAEHPEKFDSETKYRPLYLKDVETGMIDRWLKYCQKQLRDNYMMLDNRLVFSNEVVTKEDYVSKRLPYPLVEGSHDSFDKLLGKLYSDEERRKIEWAIGAVVSGDSVKIQKFLVFYGAAGTGKSTVLNILQQLFEGYYSVFDAKALGSANNSFALEAFRSNPLVAIQHDGDLSGIEDNTRLNSLVSHEEMTVNEKFKSTYSNSFRCFLFMGTNRPVRITDARSGLLRRLIDVVPTGDKFDIDEYKRLVNNVKFELGPIAKYCLDVYLSDPGCYDSYIPKRMFGASNDFYNFVEDSCFEFQDHDGITAKMALDIYDKYCERMHIRNPLPPRVVKEELKNYFKNYADRCTLSDGTRVRSYYSGFIFDKYSGAVDQPRQPESEVYQIEFRQQPSVFDTECADCPAQYASKKDTPSMSWVQVTTVLRDLDTSKVHYVQVPDNHIVIDFDIRDEKGGKSLERNVEAASKWPPTYAEVSKSGNGVHLHYIYEGDPEKLLREYDEHIEVKVFTGKSALRRKLTLCNDLPIKPLSSGLPLKGEPPPMIYPTVLKTEDSIKRQIMANLRKEVWPKLGRRPSTHEAVQMIAKILDEAYASGIHYDMSGLIGSVAGFAAQSTNHSSECLAMVARMRFKSEDISTPIPDKVAEEAPLVFFDIEVFPNLLLINWKFQGKGQPIVRMINPSPDEVRRLFSYRLVGFNNKAYDNIILWARAQGVTIQGLYEISRRIIVFKERDIGSREAKNLSYADIYDFSSKKQSLKKFEIELSRKNPELRHLELNMDWNKPVPQERWLEVSEYCDNDVIATEATFEDRKADFAARKILAELAGGTVNDSTNSLSARFIFEGVKNPQGEFNYRFLGKMPEKVYRSKADAETGVIFNNFGDEYTLFDEEGRPVFKGYTYERVNGKGVSTYRGEVVGEGGYIFAKPGMYTNVALLDIESMHPHSAIAEKVFGDYYTERFRQIVEARLAIKHKDLDKARTMLNGALAPYLDDPDLVKGLAGALKIVINSVYGESYSSFKNAFRDPRNIDNIIAKRGALFMVNLKHEVLAKGFEVAHIKTDSIKIPNATPEIIKFVQDYGEQYGYRFQHEATYERMCLVNDAVYIARYSDKDSCMKQYGYIPEKNDEHGLEWTATGTQFAVPYVFKTLFSKEPIDFYDLCEIKSVTTSMVLDMNEKLPDVSLYESELDKIYFPKRADQHGKAALRQTDLTVEELEAKIAEGHAYKFVGRVGEFCPVKPGCFGGELLRVNEVGVPETGQKLTRYSSVTGAKGYRWLESEVIRASGREGDIDMSYYNILAEKAIATISQFGDFNIFVNGNMNDIKFDPYPIIDPDATPF